MPAVRCPSLRIVAVVFGMLLLPGAASAQAPADTSPNTLPASAQAPKDTSSSSDATPIAIGASTEVSVYGDSDHVGVVTPQASINVDSPSTGWSGSGSYLVDVISAASVDIVSTASQAWHEVRQAGTLGVGYKPHDFGVQATGAISSEPDYLSITGGGTLTLDFDQKNYTALLGYSFGHDTAGRTGTPFSVFALRLNRQSINAGLDVTLDRSTLLVLIGDLVLENGDQSKPYRYIPMFAPDVAKTIPNGLNVDRVNALRLPERPLEQLPLSRQLYSLTARIAHHMGSGTIRASERLYTDSWGLKASTTDARYLFDVGDRFIVGPHVRAHVQSAVSFWKRAYTVNYTTGGKWTFPRYRTGDRELGPMAGFTLGGTASYYFGNAPLDRAWHLSLDLEGSQDFYFDDLYMTSRYAGLTAISLGGTF